MAKKPTQKSPSLNSFNALVKGHKSKIERQLKKLEDETVENFTPHIVTSCKKGEYYFLPMAGVVICTDISVINISGFGEVQTTKIEQAFVRNPARMPMTQQKLETAGMRELITAEQFEKIIEYLKKGDSTIDRSSGNPAMKKALMESISQSSNPFVLANLACQVFGKTKEMSQTGVAYIQVGNKALETLAAEYAAVKKVEYKEALKTLAHAAGKPGFEEVNDPSYLVPQYGLSN